jgi:hypothetical protein
MGNLITTIKELSTRKKIALIAIVLVMIIVVVVLLVPKLREGVVSGVESITGRGTQKVTEQRPDVEATQTPNYNKSVNELQFAENTFIHVLEGKVGVVDEDGNIIIDYVFSNALPEYTEGLLVAEYGQTGKWGVMNSEGATVIPFIYDEIKNYGSGLWAAKKDNLW